jgi:membrane-associated HD superfamily phosphohydrolase
MCLLRKLINIFISVTLISSCASSIGHNEQFKLTRGELDVNSFKLCNFKELDISPQGKENYSYLLGSRYKKSEGDEIIRAGDSINVIINRVWIEDNSEDFIYELNQEAEIGVVVSIYDGSKDDGNDILVAYEKGIEDQVALPISDLLAYSSNSYDNQAIRITISIFEFDQQENSLLSGILSKAAKIGSTNVTSSATLDISAQVGKLLIESNSDDIVAKMSFQLYPWKNENSNAIEMGVPRMTTGNHLIVNAKKGLVNDDIDLLVKADAICFRNGFEPILRVKLPDSTAATPKYTTKKLNMSYVIYTIDNTPTTNSKEILSRVNQIQRETAGLTSEGKFTVSKAKMLSNNLDFMKSSLNLFQHYELYKERKNEPESLFLLWDMDRDELKKSDIYSLKMIIKRVIPRDILKSNSCSGHVKGIDNFFSDECKNIYRNITNDLVYDNNSGRYDKEGRSNK